MRSSCPVQAFAASCHHALTVRGHIIRAEASSRAHNAVVGGSALNTATPAPLGLQLSPLGISGQCQNIVGTLIVVNHLAEEATLGVWVFLPLQQTLTRLKKMQRCKSECCSIEGGTTMRHTHTHTHIYTHTHTHKHVRTPTRSTAL